MPFYGAPLPECAQPGCRGGAAADSGLCVECTDVLAGLEAGLPTGTYHQREELFA